MDTEQQPTNVSGEPEPAGTPQHEDNGTQNFAENAVKPARSPEDKRKRLMWWIKTILLLALIAGSIALLFGITDLLSDESMPRFGEMVRGMSLPCFGILMGGVLLYMFVESAKYGYLLKISTGKFHPAISLKVMLLGKYYDGITPLGTGGQPFQIYYLHKKKIPPGVATAIPLVRYIVSTVTLCVIAAAFFVIAPRFLRGSGWGNTTLYVVAWVSMLCNLAIPVLMLIASFFPRAGKKFVIKTVHLLSKMRIVKRKYRVTRKYIYEIDEYRNSLRALLRRPFSIFPLLVLCLLETFLYFALPFMAMLAVAANVVTPSVHIFLEMFTLSLIAYYSATLVPTPGNSGALEATTSVIFATVLVKYAGLSPLIGWIVLLWRILSYYIYILAGVCINIFEVIRGAAQARKAEGKQV